MKIQCDVCSKEEASLFCTADEAALCHGCDLRIHQANKLAGKHHRFSFLHPSSPSHFPLCDICKERRAFLFCQEDRAILCRDCDLPVHSANEHTSKHNRFLLTGLKLSLTSPTMLEAATRPKRTTETSISSTTTTSSSGEESGKEMCTSSISEYLIKTIPGWHVEDLLQDLPKMNDDMLPSVESDLEKDMGGYGLESFPTWVPQVPQFESHQMVSSIMEVKNWKEMGNSNSRRWRREDMTAAVPQISQPPTKRPRAGFGRSEELI